MFTDRHDAGQRLGRLLARSVSPAERPLVLGLPRGGVVVAAEVAGSLRAEWDVMLVKKLGAPGNPELAVGAVGEQGSVWINEEVARQYRVSASDLAFEQDRATRALADQQQAYRAVRPRVEPGGRVVILVDDGLATGATMHAAIQAARLAGPARIIVAVPVAPPETVTELRAVPAVAAVVCLLAPADFASVGQFYESFDQVPDAEVTRLLQECCRE